MRICLFDPLVCACRVRKIVYVCASALMCIHERVCIYMNENVYLCMCFHVIVKVDTWKENDG